MKVKIELTKLMKHEDGSFQYAYKVEVESNSMFNEFDLNISRLRGAGTGRFNYIVACDFEEVHMDDCIDGAIDRFAQSLEFAIKAIKANKYYCFADAKCIEVDDW